jgi:hypothetical protein
MISIKKGLYYHYKHNAEGEINNYAYEVIGTGLHTEDGTHFVIYRPLYKSTFLGSVGYYIRPYEMFTGNVEINGKSVKRFERIKDEGLILKLSQIKREMYGEDK